MAYFLVFHFVNKILVIINALLKVDVQVCVSACVKRVDACLRDRFLLVLEYSCCSFFRF